LRKWFRLSSKVQCLKLSVWFSRLSRDIGSVSFMLIYQKRTIFQLGNAIVIWKLSIDRLNSISGPQSINQLDTTNWNILVRSEDHNRHSIQLIHQNRWEFENIIIFVSIYQVNSITFIHILSNFNNIVSINCLMSKD
jgi:hypothetical protein